MRLLLTVVLGLVLVAGFSSNAMAFGSIADDWKDIYLLQTCEELVMAASDCSLCHNAGFSFNEYGADIQTAKNDDPGLATWTLAINFIEDFDSDGDGRTNVEEIEDDCTLPGNPASVPNEETSWGIVKKVFESRGIEL